VIPLEFEMADIGFLGCGKIGKAMVKHLKAGTDHTVAFVQDPFFDNDGLLDCPVLGHLDKSVCRADLVVECATADVLKQYYEHYFRQGDVMVFSVTAFSDEAFAEEAFALCRSHNTRIYFPHGAILGLDGIFDARALLTRVTIETIKNPRSLGREDEVRTVLFEGPAREACQLYPRNVNVHAEIALAGLGFDRTQSRIVSDPGVDTNSHVICVSGEGINCRLEITTPATGGVTGQYTPVSACGSLDRVLGGRMPYQFV
jgi:aspartate dehydrogenase